jgi:signal transduction histidine kinase
LSLVKQIVTNHQGQVSIKSGAAGTRVAMQL